MLILETGEPTTYLHVDLVICFPIADNVCWLNLCALSLITRVKRLRKWSFM